MFAPFLILALGAAPLGAEFDVSSPQIAATTPSVAMAADGGFMVSWLEGTAPAQQLRVRRYDAAGAPAGDPQTIATGTISDQAFASSSGGFGWLAWTETILGIKEPKMRPVILSQGLVGDLISPRSTSPAKDAFGVDVACYANGDVFVAWMLQESPNDVDIYYRVYLADGTPRLSADRVLSTNVRRDVNPSVAVPETITPGGLSAVIAWEEYNATNTQQIKFKLINDAFNAFGAPIPTDPKSTSRSIEPSVVLAGNGSIVVSWSKQFKPGDNDLYVKSFTSAGAENSALLVFSAQSFDERRPCMRYAPLSPVPRIAYVGTRTISGNSDAIMGQTNPLLSEITFPGSFDSVDGNETSPKVAIQPNGESIVVVALDDAGGTPHVIARRFATDSIASKDTDGDGLADLYELANNSNPNNSASAPAALDLNGNGRFDLGDAMLSFVQRNNQDPLFPPDFPAAWDLNKDNQYDTFDGYFAYQNRIGVIEVLP